MAWIEIHIDGGDNKTINLNFYKYIEPAESGAKTSFLLADHTTSLLCDVPYAMILDQLGKFLFTRTRQIPWPFIEVNDRADELDKLINFELFKHIEARDDYTRCTLPDESLVDINADYADFTVNHLKEFTAGIDQFGNPLQPVDV